MSDHKIELKDGNVKDDVKIIDIPNSLGAIRWSGESGGEDANQFYILLSHRCSVIYASSVKSNGDKSLKDINNPAEGNENICDSDKPIYFVGYLNSIYEPYGGSCLVKNADMIMLSQLSILREGSNYGAIMSMKGVYTELTDGRKRLNVIANTYSST